MGYGFDQKTNEQVDSKFIKVGIQDNLELKEWKFNPADERLSQNIEITLMQRDADGTEVTATRRYFEPTIGEFNKTAEDLEKAQTKFSRIIKNFCTKFLGEQYEIPAQPSFEAFCRKAIADVGVRCKGVKLRGMIVYNNGGFPTLRSFSPVVELMTTPREQSKLKPTDYDLLEAPEKRVATPAGPSNTGLPAGENIF